MGIRFMSKMEIQGGLPSLCKENVRQAEKMKNTKKREKESEREKEVNFENLG